MFSNLTGCTNQQAHAWVTESSRQQFWGGGLVGREGLRNRELCDLAVFENDAVVKILDSIIDVGEAH